MTEYESLAKHATTAHQRRDQALQTLAGIITGIEADRLIKPVEVDYLTHWIAEHARVVGGTELIDL
jgi:hypothetical protein